MSSNQFLSLFESMRGAQRLRRISSENERLEKLQRLQASLTRHQVEIREALAQDLGRAPAETDIVDFLPVMIEIKDALRNLKCWLKPKRVSTPLMLLGTKSQIRFEPKGVVLIISPWNYPLNLTLAPLVSAIAAGNRCIVKPSELSPATNRVMQKILSECFSSAEVVMIEGDAKTSQELLELPFDHIFFTGSTRVGRFVQKAAAENFTSVTLELGGKSPAIVDQGTDLRLAAERIVWSKFINAGQTCVATDYVFVHRDDVDNFLRHCGAAVQKYYGETDSPNWKPQDYAKIVSSQHFARLKSICDEAISKGAKLALGGRFDMAPYIPPTILTHASLETQLMKEEIFGPLLPVLTYSNYEELTAVLRSLSHPLAMYVFTNSKNFADRILSDFPSGGVCINTAIIHLGNSKLPFGGIGPSGMGSYHGHFGFRAFSHERAVLRQGRFEVARNFRPPYTPFLQKLVEFALRYLT